MRQLGGREPEVGLLAQDAVQAGHGEAQPSGHLGGGLGGAGGTDGCRGARRHFTKLTKKRAHATADLGEREWRSTRVAVNIGGRRRRFRGIWAVAVRRTRVHHLRGSDADHDAAQLRRGFKAAAQQVAELEKAGLDMVWVAEAYGFDAPSFMGYLAANTDASRSPSASCRSTRAPPTLLAMTAAGIDALSDGRCMLGLGASGPQVIEGWHGVPYDAPLGRTREIIEICREVWAPRGAARPTTGSYYTLPSPRDRAPASASRSRSSPTPCATASRSSRLARPEERGR